MMALQIIKGTVKQNLSMTMAMMTPSLSQLSKPVDNDGDDDGDAADDDGDDHDDKGVSSLAQLSNKTR